MLLLGIVPSAFAGILDQEHVVPDAGGLIVYRSQTLHQTFTAGLTGLMDRIEFQAFWFNGPTENLNVDVYRTAGVDSSVPVGSILGSKSIPRSGVPRGVNGEAAPFTAVDLAPFAVTAGETLAIRLSSNENYVTTNCGYGWNVTNDTSYSRGQLVATISTGDTVTDTLTDTGFRTYVTPVPEPATLSALGVGLVALRRRARRIR